MTIGKRILNQRKKLKLTQKELSDMTGIPISTISDYEKDKSQPSAKNISKISKAVKSDISWLMCGEIENKNLSTIELDIINMFKALDERDKEDILDFMKIKYDKIKKR